MEESLSACPPEETLAELVERSLSTSAAADVHKHVRGCARCRAILAGLADALGADAAALEEQRMAAGAEGAPPSQSRTLEMGTRLAAREEALDPGPSSVRFDLGARIGRFEIERLIGLGGMGAVYAARDPELSRTVALKLLRVGRGGGLDPNARRGRLLREAQAMARLAHPNVVAVFQVGEFEDRLFVVMELVEGGNLTQWLREQPRSVEQILEAFIAAGRGLAAAHAAGIVHRDFKPDNVLVGSDGRVRVTDFGLARPVIADEPLAPLAAADLRAAGNLSPGEGLTPMGALVGTPAYMAPEQLGGHPIDARADIFSFCTSLFEALYGKRPFAAATLFELRNKIEQGDLEPAPLRSRVPGWLRREIVRGLAHDPAARPASINELLEAVQRGRARAQRRRTWLRAGAAALLIAGLSLAALWRWPAGGGERPRAQGRRAVAVLGPRNLSGRPESAWLSAALGEMLGTEIGADGTLRLLPAEQVARTVDDLALPPGASLPPSALARLRQIVGADAVISGSYLVASGGQLRLDLRLWDAATGEALASIAESGEEQRLFELVSRAGTQLRRSLGGDPLTLAHAAQASFPAHPEAARLYAAGLSQKRSFDLGAARESLSRAAELAPDNPRILGALSDVLLLLGRSTEAREAARKAFEGSGKLGRDERLRVELAFRHSSKDFARATDIARALFTFFPDDVESGLKLAEEELAGQKAADSLETIAALRKLPEPARQDVRIDLAEAEAASQLGDQKRAVEAAARAAATARARGSRWLLARALYAEADAARLQGNHERARVGFAGAKEQYRELKDRYGFAKAATLGATVLADDGDLRGAAEQFRTASATFHELGNQRSEGAIEHNLSIVCRRLRDLGPALEHSLRAKELYGLVAADPAAMASTLIVQGHVRQDLGDLPGAAAAFVEAVELRRQARHRQLGNALTALAHVKILGGDLQAARTLLAEGQQVTRADDNLQRGEVNGATGRLLAAEGKHAEAAVKLAEAGRLLLETNKRDESAIYEAGLARSLVVLGRPAEAVIAIERGRRALGTTSSVMAQPRLEIAAARARVALHPDQRAAGLGDLEAVRAEAVRTGVLEDQLEARLAILELRDAADPTDERGPELAAQAREKGFELIARSAEAVKR